MNIKKYFVYVLMSFQMLVYSSFVRSSPTTPQLPKLTSNVPDEKVNSNFIEQLESEVESIFRNPNISDYKKRLSSRLKNKSNAILDDAIVDVLSSFGTVKFSSDIFQQKDIENFSASLDMLIPLHRRNKDIFFTQLGYRLNPKNRFGGRDFFNIGLGYRYYTKDFLVGLNVFYDLDVTRKHKRMSVGLEYWRSNMKLSGNYYFPLSGWESSKDLQSYLERPASGFDFDGKFYLPNNPKFRVYLGYQRFSGGIVDIDGSLQGNMLNDLPSFLGDKTIYSYSYGVEYQPVSALSVSLGRRVSRSGGSATSSYMVKAILNYRFGIPLKKQFSADFFPETRKMSWQVSDLVKRNNDIVLAYKKNKLSSQIDLIGAPVVALSLTPAKLSFTLSGVPLLNNDVLSNGYSSEWKLNSLLIPEGDTKNKQRISVLVPPFDGNFEYSVKVTKKNTEGQPEVIEKTASLVVKKNQQLNNLKLFSDAVNFNQATVNFVLKTNKNELFNRLLAYAKKSSDTTISVTSSNPQVDAKLDNKLTTVTLSLHNNAIVGNTLNNVLVKDDFQLNYVLSAPNHKKIIPIRLSSEHSNFTDSTTEDTFYKTKKFRVGESLSSAASDTINSIKESYLKAVGVPVSERTKNKVQMVWKLSFNGKPRPLSSNYTFREADKGGKLSLSLLYGFSNTKTNTFTKVIELSESSINMSLFYNGDIISASLLDWKNKTNKVVLVSGMSLNFGEGDTDSVTLKIGEELKGISSKSYSIIDEDVGKTLKIFIKDSDDEQSTTPVFSTLIKKLNSVNDDVTVKTIVYDSGNEYSLESTNPAIKILKVVGEFTAQVDDDVTYKDFITSRKIDDMKFRVYSNAAGTVKLSYSWQMSLDGKSVITMPDQIKSVHMEKKVQTVNFDTTPSDVVKFIQAPLDEVFVHNNINVSLSSSRPDSNIGIAYFWSHGPKGLDSYKSEVLSTSIPKYTVTTLDQNQPLYVSVVKFLKDSKERLSVHQVKVTDKVFEKVYSLEEMIDVDNVTFTNSSKEPALASTGSRLFIDEKVKFYGVAFGDGLNVKVKVLQNGALEYKWFDKSQTGSVCDLTNFQPVTEDTIELTPESNKKYLYLYIRRVDNHCNVNFFGLKNTNSSISSN